MKPMKSITVLEEAMDTVNQVLKDAANNGNVDAMEELSHQMVDLSKVLADLYSSAGIADSMDKLHELAKTVRDKKEASPEDIAQLGACVAPLPFMAAKPPTPEGSTPFPFDQR